MDNNRNNNNNRGNNNRGGNNAPRRPSDAPKVESDVFERVVQVNRVSKKTKGGDKRSLSVLVVVGDRKGKVGVGLGKAADVQSAVAKATNYAKRHLNIVPIKNGTIPHQLYIKNGAAKILLKPAKPGTGVIAGGAVRVVAEAAGIQDIVAKILGTKNRASNIYATLEGLRQLKTVAGEVKAEEKATETEVEETEVTEEKTETKKPAKKGKAE